MAEHYAVWLVDRRGGREAGWEAVTASGAGESGVTLSLWSPPSGALVWLCPRRSLERPCLTRHPPLPPSVVSSGGGLAGRGASQDLSHSVGHFSLRLPVAGSGTIILVHDLAVGPAPDSLRPQILLPHLHPRPAPELLGHPPWACAGGTPLVLGWPGESVPLEDTWVRVLAHPWDCGKSLPPLENEGMESRGPQEPFWF